MNSRSNMSKMGKHIADLRKSKGYTQKTLGDILDVSDKTVSKWEKGVVAPDITILNSLASTLDISVEELLAGEEVTKPNTIEAIDIYSKMTKNKLLKVFAIFILLFILCAFLIFRIEDYYSWHLTTLYSKDTISTKGYILYNNKESKITINEFYISQKILDNSIESISIELRYSEKKIYEELISIDENNIDNDILHNYVICTDIKEKINSNELELIIVIKHFNGYKDVITTKY